MRLPRKIKKDYRKFMWSSSVKIGPGSRRRWRRVVRFMKSQHWNPDDFDIHFAKAYPWKYWME